MSMSTTHSAAAAGESQTAASLTAGPSTSASASAAVPPPAKGDHVLPSPPVLPSDWNKLLNRKVALITGAAGAIGREIAVVFARHGAKVSVCDALAQVEETAQLINTQVTDRTADAMSSVVDVRDEKQVKQWVEGTRAKFGSIDILVNNAATFIFGEVDKVSSEDWDRVLSTNIKGYALTAKYAVQVMKEQRSGSILHIASISSVISQPKFVPYSVTKAAVLQMSRCIAQDVGEYNIRCNAIGPGSIETPATRKHAEVLGISYEDMLKKTVGDHFLNYMGQPSDVANASVFICSDLSRFTSGALWMIDGGYTTH